MSGDVISVGLRKSINELYFEMGIPADAIGTLISDTDEQHCLSALKATKADKRANKAGIFRGEYTRAAKRRFDGRAAVLGNVAKWSKEAEDALARGYQPTAEAIKKQLYDQMILGPNNGGISQKDYQFGLKGLPLVGDIMETLRKAKEEADEEEILDGF